MVRIVTRLQHSLGQFFTLSALPELAAVLFFGLVYISLFMPLAPNDAPAGVESERLTGVLLPIEIGLKNYGHIPTWNPYMGIGEPQLNDAFNYLFNPFMSAPILVFGAIPGSKIAIALGLLLAGCNMWAFARAIGLGGVARVTAGVLYLASGGIAAKFQPGHFQLGLSLAWCPLVFAGLWWTLHTSDRRALLLMALAFALLFFSGNIYYTLHTLISCVVIVLVHLVEGGRLRLDRLRRVTTGGLFAFGLAALQFMPIWAVRAWVNHDKADILATRYTMQQALINLTTPIRDWWVFDLPPYTTIVGVDYSYVGVIIICALIAAVPVLVLTSGLRRSRLPVRAILIAIILIAVMMIWGAGQTDFLKWLYDTVPLLSEFRYLGRALAVAGLWWIVLGAIAIDILWKAASDLLKTRLEFNHYDRLRLIRAASLGAAAWAIYVAVTLMRLPPATVDLASVLDSFRFDTGDYLTQIVPNLGLFVLAAIALDTVLLLVEQRLAAGKRRAKIYGITRRTYVTRLLRMGIMALALAAMADLMQVNWALFDFGVRNADMQNFYTYIHQKEPDAPIPAVREPNSRHFAFEPYEHEIRLWGLSEGWAPVPLPSLTRNAELDVLPQWVIATLPEERDKLDGYTYLFQQCSDFPPQNPDAPCDFTSIMAAGLYRRPNALPYAFVASTSTLTDHPDRLLRPTVTAVSNILHQQDTITLHVQVPENSTRGDYSLVVQETHFTGWLAFIDDVPVNVEGFEQFIGIPMPPGEHTVTLRYQPPGFTTGLILFVVTLVGMGFYVRKPSPKTL